MLFKVRLRLSHFDPVGPLQVIRLQLHFDVESRFCSSLTIGSFVAAVDLPGGDLLGQINRDFDGRDGAGSLSKTLEPEPNQSLKNSVVVWLIAIQLVCDALAIRKSRLHLPHLRCSLMQSAALIKNVRATLPLSKATAGTVAVIGPNALLSQSDAVRQQCQSFLCLSLPSTVSVTLSNLSSKACDRRGTTGPEMSARGNSGRWLTQSRSTPRR